MKKILTLLFIFALVVGLIAEMFNISSPYFILSPGSVLQIDQILRIPAIPEEQQVKRGHFYLTTVAIQEATLAQWVMSHFDPTTRAIPREQLIPNDVSPEDMGKLELQLMEESKTVAKIVALRKAGYEVSVSGEGVKVEAILPQSLALDKLMIGDIIVAFDGQKVQTAPDLIDLVSKKNPGDIVSLTVNRNGSPQDVEVETITSPSEAGRAAIGISVTTYLFDFNLPFDIEIDTENIGGPSAGLMFSLGIYNALQMQDITQGYRIAGTGTISMDGSVGPIDGVTQKAIGAERAGAQYFLSPPENYEEAKRASKNMQVVSISSFDDALNFLGQLAVAPDTAVSSRFLFLQPVATSAIYP